MTVPPGLPPAPPADRREYRVAPGAWGYWTVALPCVLMLGWAFLISAIGLVGSTIGGEGVSGADPRRGAASSYAGWQLAVFLAVLAALLIAAVFQRRRPAIALTVWGIFLLDVGCLFLIAAVYPV